MNSAFIVVVVGTTFASGLFIGLVLSTIFNAEAVKDAQEAGYMRGLNQSKRLNK